MTENEYLKHQAESLTDGVSVQHEDACGQCHKQRIVSKAARRMIRWVKTPPKDPIRTLHGIADRTWRRSKYSRFIGERLQAGQELEQALEAMRKEKGWEP